MKKTLYGLYLIDNKKFSCKSKIISLSDDLHTAFEKCVALQEKGIYTCIREIKQF